jgi:glucokinase
LKSAIGIDIGGTNIKMVIASDDGRVLANSSYPTPHVLAESPEGIDIQLVSLVKEFLNSDDVKKVLPAAPDLSGVVGIGIGVAGLIDNKNGIVLKSPNISSLNGLNLKAAMEEAFSKPVLVENDANTCAYGEKWIGTGKDFDCFVVLTLGTGLGSGIIYNGKLLKGAAELGHMVISPKGRVCTCGNLGCLESYASGRAIVERVIASLEKGEESMLTECCDGNFYKITPEIIYEIALEGDNLCRKSFRKMGYYLGIGIANIINILSPEAVIIGGGLVGAWDMFIEELKQEASKRAFDPLYAATKILKSSLTEECGSVGAAGLIFKAAG